MIRRSTAVLATGGLVAASLAFAAPATATDRDFRVGGAQADFSVDKDHGRYEVEVDIDHARPGSKWRITLWHDGKRYFKTVRTAQRDGDVRDVERTRPNTQGKDVFKVKITRIGGEGKTRTITKA
jgi:hypothetical protein